MFKAVYFKSLDIVKKEILQVDSIESWDPLLKMVLYKEGVPIKYSSSFYYRIIDVDDKDRIPTGNLLVKITDLSQFYSHLSSNNLKLVKFYDNFNIGIITIPYNQNVYDFKDEIEKLSFIDICELDCLCKIETTYDITYDHPYHWYLQNINSLEAWNLMEGNFPSQEHVEVAVWDTLLDITHPELQGKISEHSFQPWSTFYTQLVTPTGYTFNHSFWSEVGNISINNVPLIITNRYHGTGVSGIVASSNSNNNMMLSAGNDKVKVQFLSSIYDSSEILNSLQQSGWDDSLTPPYNAQVYLSIFVEAMNSVLNNPKCVALSFSTHIPGNPNPIIQEIFTVLATQGRNGKGIVIFSASGNDGFSNEVVPFGNYDYVYAVGASNALNLKAGFSNHGPDLFICAPGENILSLSVVGPLGSNLPIPSIPFPFSGTQASQDLIFTNQCLLIANGTSSSSPMVATVAATLMWVNPSLTRQQVLDILAETARKTIPVDPELTGYTWVNGRCDALGFGIIDHEAAMQLAIDYLTEPEQEPVYLYDLDISIQITEIPETVDNGSTFQITSLVTIPQETLDYAEYIVIEYWIGDDNYFGSTTEMIGSLVRGNLLLSEEFTTTVNLPCLKIGENPETYTIFAVVQAFDEFYNGVTFIPIDSQDSTFLQIEGLCIPDQPEIGINIRYQGIRYNRFFSIQDYMSVNHLISVQNLGDTQINKVNFLIYIEDTEINGLSPSGMTIVGPGFIPGNMFVYNTLDTPIQPGQTRNLSVVFPYTFSQLNQYIPNSITIQGYSVNSYIGNDEYETVSIPSTQLNTSTRYFTSLF
jgi:subtilisin family serine protease